MVTSGKHPLRGVTIRPTVLVTHNRFIGNTREQCTVAGEPVLGGAPEDIAAGGWGVCEDIGSTLITTGAAIPLIAGVAGTQYAWVQTDAAGMAIPWAGGAANTAGKIFVAAIGPGELTEVHLESKAAPLIP